MHGMSVIVLPTMEKYELCYARQVDSVLVDTMSLK